MIYLLFVVFWSYLQTKVRTLHASFQRVRPNYFNFMIWFSGKILGVYFTDLGQIFIFCFPFYIFSFEWQHNNSTL